MATKTVPQTVAVHPKKGRLTLECDEIWSFVGAKAKNVPSDKKDEFGFGDVWTWVAIDADTKLVPCWHVGKRDAQAAGLAMRVHLENARNRMFGN